MFKKLVYILTPGERKIALMLLAMILVMAFLDMLGVASIMPLITLLTNPDIIETNSILKKTYEISEQFGIKNTNQFIFIFGILVFFLIIFSLGFKALTIYVQIRFSAMREYSIGKRLVEGFLHQPYSWFLNRHSADLGKTVLSEVSLVISHGIKPVMNLITYSTITIMLVTLLILVDPKLSIIVGFILGLAYGIIYKLTRTFLKRIGEERMIANEERFRTITEAFGAAKEIKVSGLEKIYTERFANPAKTAAKHAASAQLIGNLPRYILEAIAFGGMVLMILYLMARSGTFIEALPIISLYAFAGYRLMPALQQIYVSMSQLRYIGSSLDSLYDDLRSFKSTYQFKKNETLQLQNSIKLNNINYSYPKSSKVALKDINIIIPAKNTIGIVGATGSGKTTLVDIILGLFEPQTGTLEVDNVVITNDNRRNWQRSIGYVPQQIFLADDSVSANIAFGVDLEKIDQDAVERVAKIANLHDFVINELPKKYKTTIGERGVRLSGGQCQRIGIARALYHNPKILILDEATSSLDNLTEKAVMEAVHKLGDDITIISIAHRLSTVKKCDKIFLLEKGILKGQGKFEDLIQISKSFRATASNM